MTPIKTIDEELAACVLAFTDYPEATWAWCCHHDIHVEVLTEPFQERINYILANKNECEQALRFRNFRPVKDVSQSSREIILAGEVCKEAWKTREEAQKIYEEAHKTRDEAHKTSEEERKAYEEAWKTGEEAWKTREEARKIYEEAHKTLQETWKTREEACETYEEARKTCEKIWRADKDKLIKQHTPEWSNNTWNGESIFPGSHRCQL